ncbi:hypothetical protein [Azospirillum sp. B4]|uniref:hypothetical protein n=1 Tax=Azospirillum sp. B4 TaxID=95605 RepID=UPI0003482D47|nr:hypothetical protein [Azospirillum sp. B4]
MTTTYTVFRRDDSSVVDAQGLTLREAAECLLTQDGYAFEIRSVDGFLQLFTSTGSRNSPIGARDLRPTRFQTLDGVDALYRDIITDTWHGYTAMTDTDFSAMLASFEEDE